MNFRGKPPYNALDDSQKEIRLITITGESNGSLTCGLHVVSLQAADVPPFTALSYVWGHDPPTKKIVLNGADLAITPSLNSALHSIRAHWQKAFPERHPSTFRFWVSQGPNCP